MKKYYYIISVAVFLGVLAWAFLPFSKGLPEVETALSAQADYFLKIDGIDGESADKNHKGEIDVLSWSWGVTQTGSMGTGGGGGAGKASFQDLSVTKSVDKSSPQLMLHAANGKHIKEAKLFVRKAGGREDYYVVTLKDVLVTSYQSSGQDGNVPTDQFSLNYSKIEFEYKQTDRAGRVLEVIRAAWDIAMNMVL